MSVDKLGHLHFLVKNTTLTNVYVNLEAMDIDVECLNNT